MKKARVICAMSGGVDSSVAAALLKKQGYDVIGVFMKFWSDRSVSTFKENTCCSLEASTAARAVAKNLDIPFYILNFEEEFKKRVVENFLSEYEAGRTPNPCVVCNRDIKGEILMQKAFQMEADFLATGHYARITSTAGNPKSEILNPKPASLASRPASQRGERSGRAGGQIQNSKNSKKKQILYHLYQSQDKIKDQTYFLWTLTQEKLAKMLFPIGHLTKPEVRSMAKEMKLPTAERRESQGLCFIPDADVAGFLRRYAKKLLQPGKIVDISGRTLGTHHGLIHFTVGQRENLGLGGPKAYFVVELNCRENILIVGDDADLYQKKLKVKGLNWVNPDFQNQQLIGAGGRIRYGHAIEACQIRQDGALAEVTFQKAQRAITPGQSIVFYLPAGPLRCEASRQGYNDEVFGGGIIAENSQA